MQKHAKPWFNNSVYENVHYNVQSTREPAYTTGMQIQYIHIILQNRHLLVLWYTLEFRLDGNGRDKNKWGK